MEMMSRVEEIDKYRYHLEASRVFLKTQFQGLFSFLDNEGQNQNKATKE